MGKMRFFYLIAFLLETTALFAATDDPSQVLLAYSWNPYLGRILLSGTATKYGILGADGILPIYGNREGFGFADLMGSYANDDTFTISPGGGYRKAFDNQIIGGYFFGDYEKTSLGPEFWDLSPGIEWMSSRWDAHLNAYFPTTKTKRSGADDFLSNFGNYSHVSFQTGTHNQYDELAAPYANIGNGMDAEVGYSFPNAKHLRSRAYLGSYLYVPPSSVSTYTGITAGFQEPFSKNLAIEIENSYDKVSKYTIGVSLNVTFGGNLNVYSNDVEDRILDPIERHVGIIGTGAGTYDQKSLKDLGTALQYNNVYFIAPGSGSSNIHDPGLVDPSDIGTYGSPAVLDQGTLDEIHALNPNGVRIYIQGGNTYTLSSSGLKPYNNQSFYGRTSDYTAAATGNVRPILYQPTASSMIFELGHYGDSTNTLSDLQFTGDITKSSIQGIESLANPIDVTINDSAFSNFSGGALYFGSAPANVTVTNSTFSNNATAINYTPDSGTLTVQNSEITADSDFAYNPSGITVTNGGSNTLTFNADNLEILFNGNAGAAQGISFQNQSSGEINANIDHLTLTGTGAGGGSGIEIYNGLGSSADAGTVNVTINHSLIEGNGNNGGYGNIYIDAQNGGVTNFNFLNSTSSDGASYGLLVVNNHFNDTVNVAINNSVFNSSGVNLGSPYPFGNIGIWSLGAGTVNLSATNSTISNTTNSVPALWISNQGGTGSTIDVQSLSGTHFLDNSGGGINAYAETGTSTTINYGGAIFDSSTPAIATDPSSTGTVTWINGSTLANNDMNRTVTYSVGASVGHAAHEAEKAVTRGLAKLDPTTWF